MSDVKKAVILLSGGLDSTTCAAIARSQGFELYALTLFYGQRHDVELTAAKRAADFFEVERHILLSIDLRAFGGSALTDDIDVPKHDSEQDIDSGIPVTYVPARNTIFLSYAMAWAEVLGAYDIFIGVNSLDYSGYPDCRPEFISSFETMANLATKAGVEGNKLNIHTPLSELTKGQIIQEGIRLGVDYSITHSCYDPSPEGISCGHCDSCLLRLRGFSEARSIDPIDYQNMESE